MDEVSRGIAAASLTLQSALLQALVVKRVLSQDEAIQIADKSLAAACADLRDEDEGDAADVTIACFERIREGLA